MIALSLCVCVCVTTCVYVRCASRAGTVSDCMPLLRTTPMVHIHTHILVHARTHTFRQPTRRERGACKSFFRIKPCPRSPIMLEQMFALAMADWRGTGPIYLTHTCHRVHDPRQGVRRPACAWPDACSIWGVRLNRLNYLTGCMLTIVWKLCKVK